MNGCVYRQDVKECVCDMCGAGYYNCATRNTCPMMKAIDDIPEAAECAEEKTNDRT